MLMLFKNQAFSYWEWTYGIIHTQELAMSYSTCHCFYNQVIAIKNNKVLKLLFYNVSCNKKHVNYSIKALKYLNS